MNVVLVAVLEEKPDIDRAQILEATAKEIEWMNIVVIMKNAKVKIFLLIKLPPLKSS